MEDQNVYYLLKDTQDLNKGIERRRRGSKGDIVDGVNKNILMRK